jgi:hypothetical protein
LLSRHELIYDQMIAAVCPGFCQVLAGSCQSHVSAQHQHGSQHDRSHTKNPGVVGNPSGANQHHRSLATPQCHAGCSWLLVHTAANGALLVALSSSHLAPFQRRACIYPSTFLMMHKPQRMRGTSLAHQGKSRNALISACWLLIRKKGGPHLLHETQLECPKLSVAATFCHLHAAPFDCANAY